MAVSRKSRAPTQLVQSGSTIIARVLSTDPFIIENVAGLTSGRKESYSPRPVIRDLQTSPEETRPLREGDIISATLYSYLVGGEELGLATGIRNIRRLGEQAKSEYSKKGLLIFYARVTNSPNSYLTIYRDGTVICQDTPGNYITNKQLSEDELRKLTLEFEAAGIDHIASAKNLKEYDPALVSSIGKYHQLELQSPLPNLKRFLAQLDSLIEGYIDKATYRISYYRRFVIKDWPYENIIALDEITDAFGDAYRYKHQVRLSRIKPSASFMAEAVETCKDSCVLYRYKNKIYAFYLSLTCSDGTTGSWACFRATELQFGKIDSATNWGYIDWPINLGLKLNTIGMGGLDIAAREYTKNPAFYKRLLNGSGFMYKEGNYIYQGINTRYH